MRLFKKPGSTIEKLLATYPGVPIRLLIVAGFEFGLRQVQSALIPYRDRVELIASCLFKEEDRCFVQGSRIFSDPVQCDLVRAFCLEVAEQHYPRLPKSMRLGVGEIGALAVFFDTVPNNSLPILWHDEGTWLPLFPASGLLPAD